MQIEELLKDIQHLGHLGKYDYFRAFVIQGFQKLSQLLKLTAVILDQVSVREEQNI